jgi:hypothetical protein
MPDLHSAPVSIPKLADTGYTTVLMKDDTAIMNIVPGLHLALVSVPKLADAGCTTLLTKDGAAIYNDNTTAITVSNPPIL